MAGLPPWLQKGQDQAPDQKGGDMKNAAKKNAIQKRIDANNKKKKAGK